MEIGIIYQYFYYSLLLHVYTVFYYCIFTYGNCCELHECVSIWCITRKKTSYFKHEINILLLAYKTRIYMDNFLLLPENLFFMIIVIIFSCLSFSFAYPSFFISFVFIYALYFIIDWLTDEIYNFTGWKLVYNWNLYAHKWIIIRLFVFSLWHTKKV